MLVDLRSDTMTRPDAAMRKAMAEAEVGDDVYGEDPTVNALEAEVADLFGHEAAVFVPSGTMSNQIGVRLLVEPGSELILENDAHIVTYEAAAAAVVGGVQTRTLVGARGIIDPGLLSTHIRRPAFHVVSTAAVSVEQTHNRGGGSVYPLETLQEIRRVSAEAGALLHCDGARIWNAHVATGVPLATYGGLVDVVSASLCKGLGAPVGSVVVTSATRADEARHLRQRLGGAMRQSGILAAAGLHGIHANLGRLADDHAHARQLADRCADVLPGCVDPASVDTNIVIIDVGVGGHDPSIVVEAAGAHGVLISEFGGTTIRLVTHLDVGDEQTAHAADVLAKILG